MACTANETESTQVLDLRTRYGNEQLVLRQVEEFGGFSIWWVTENQRRACAAMRLGDSGQIVAAGGQFPWCAYELVER